MRRCTAPGRQDPLWSLLDVAAEIREIRSGRASARAWGQAVGSRGPRGVRPPEAKARRALEPAVGVGGAKRSPEPKALGSAAFSAERVRGSALVRGAKRSGVGGRAAEGVMASRRQQPEARTGGVRRATRVRKRGSCSGRAERPRARTGSRSAHPGTWRARRGRCRICTRRWSSRGTARARRGCRRRGG